MERALWLAKKNQLCSLIKKVSDGYGGDEIGWLRAYCLDVIADHPDEKIEAAILCFMELAEQLKHVPRRTRTKYEQKGKDNG